MEQGIGFVKAGSRWPFLVGHWPSCILIYTMWDERLWYVLVNGLNRPTSRKSLRCCYCGPQFTTSPPLWPTERACFMWITLAVHNEWTSWSHSATTPICTSLCQASIPGSSTHRGLSSHCQANCSCMAPAMQIEIGPSSHTTFETMFMNLSMSLGAITWSIPRSLHKCNYLFHVVPSISKLLPFSSWQTDHLQTLK